MPGETDLSTILKTLKPQLNKGDYVFCTMPNADHINSSEIVCFFREQEGHTLILPKTYADQLGLSYQFIAAWITLSVHSSLEAVGLTAAFAQALAQHGISCNVVAAYYHDHIFVNRKDAAKAMEVLNQLTKQ